MNYSIYGIYNLNRLLYIGSTKDFNKRISCHLSNIKNNNTNSKIKLYQYIKSNKLNIEIKKLYDYNCNKEEIGIKENEIIKKLNPPLNIRSGFKQTRNKFKSYHQNYYNYRKEIKLLMNINY
jgi:predicted GIY-YIG superfamily endonuclease